MSKEIEPTEFKVVTKNDVIVYEGFDRKLAVKAYYDKVTDRQFERTGDNEWKLKFYKPSGISI